MTSPAPRYEPDEEDFATPIGPMSFEEYLAFEDASDRRHKFVDGFAYAMSPVRRGHNSITLNIAARLWTRTRGTRCHADVEHSAIGGVLALEEIYERQDLPPDPPPRPLLRRVGAGEPAEAYGAESYGDVPADA